MAVPNATDAAFRFAFYTAPSAFDLHFSAGHLLTFQKLILSKEVWVQFGYYEKASDTNLTVGFCEFTIGPKCGHWYQYTQLPPNCNCEWYREGICSEDGFSRNGYLSIFSYRIG
jgi:hypothetical protein